MLKPSFLLGRLHRQQETMLMWFHDMPGDELRRSPGPGEWSLLEVLGHVTKVEEAVAGSIRAKLSKPLQATTAMQTLRGAGLVAFTLSPWKIQMPGDAARFTSPEADGELDVLAARWRAARGSFAALDYPNISPRAVVFRNPVSGWLTVSGTLRFLLAHTFHHRYQLRRIVRTVRRHVASQ